MKNGQCPVCNEYAPHGLKRHIEEKAKNEVWQNRLREHRGEEKLPEPHFDYYIKNIKIKYKL